MAPGLTDRATDEELDRLQAAIEAQRVEIREYLARELGGDPDEYRAEHYLSE